MAQKLLIFYLIFFYYCLNAQQKSSLSFGGSINSFGSNSVKPIQFPPLSASLYLGLQKHEIGFGPDVYGVNYLGYHASIIGCHVYYKYYLLKDPKNLNFYFDARLNYVKFYQGGGLSSTSKRHNWYEVISTMGSCGVGICYSFLQQRATAFGSFNGGLNYFESVYSNNQDALRIANYEEGKKFKAVFLFNLGLSFRAWKIKSV